MIGRSQNNHKGMTLVTVVGKVYGRIVISSIVERTRKLNSEEQGEFVEGNRCNA